MRTILIIVYCVLHGSLLLGQSGKQFYMTPPPQWENVSDQVIYDNLNQFLLRPAQLDSFLTSYKGAVKLYKYTKYKPTEYNGLIPTIVVSLYKQSPKTFDQFFAKRKADIESKKTLFPNFQYVDPVQAVTVAGRQVVYYANTYELQTETKVHHVRNRTYLIPAGDVFYQLNFADGDGEDCADLFDELVKSITFK